MDKVNGTVQRLQNLSSILRHSLQPQLRHDTNTSSALTSSPPSLPSLLSESKTYSSQPACSINVNPPVTQFDETVQIRVSSLGRHAPVTLQGWVRTRWRKREVLFVSHGHFYADQEGNLDLNTDPALDGTYTGVDPAGLFWSLKPLPAHPQDMRLVIRDVTKPLVVNIAVFSGHIIPNDDTVALTSLKPLCMTSVQRRLLAPGVTRMEVREGRIRGTLFLPPGEGLHPGVIDMFGAAGSKMEGRAALLAAHGFAALSLPYFAFDDLPSKMSDVQFDYFEEAADWLASHPAVRKGGIGVVGVSSGACNAMLMAAQCPQVKAVVEINGPPYQIVNDFLRNGEVFRRMVGIDPSKVQIGKEGYITRDAYIITDDDYFPVWKRDARILCLVCQDDQQAAWEHALHLRDLYPQHKRHLIDVVVYPRAGHLLEPPYTPHCRYCHNPSAMGNVLWGGEPKAHAVAQLDAWRRTINFLHTWLANTETSAGTN